MPEGHLSWFCSGRIELRRPPYTGAMVFLLLLSLGAALASSAQPAAAQTTEKAISSNTGARESVTPNNFQPLTGCTNPNTGVSNQDWGVESNPVYINSKT